MWLQEFAWTEAEKEERLHMRCSSNAHCSDRDKSELKQEPMFCLETAINMLYWSALVYDYEEVSFASCLKTTVHAMLLRQCQCCIWKRQWCLDLIIENAGSGLQAKPGDSDEPVWAGGVGALLGEEA